MRSVFTNFRASFSVWPKFGLWPLFQSVLVQKSQAWGLPGHTVGSFALRTENDCFWGWKFFFHFPGLVLPGEIFFYNHTWAQCQTWFWAKNFFEIVPFLGRFGQNWPNYGFQGFSQKPMCPPLPMPFECVFRWKLPQLTTYPRSGRPFLSRSDIFEFLRFSPILGKDC